MKGREGLCHGEFALVWLASMIKGRGVVRRAPSKLLGLKAPFLVLLEPSDLQAPHFFLHQKNNRHDYE